MAFKLQSASNTSVAATVAATFGATPTQGNLLVAAVTASVGVGSIAISGWSSGSSIALGVAGGMVVFYKVAGIGESATVTSTATLATFMDLHIFEYDGINNASPLDKAAVSADSGSGVTSHNTGSTGTLSQGIELAFAAVGQAATNGAGASWDSSFTTEITTTHLITGDLSVNATTALNPTASWTTSQRAAGIILTFFGETGDSYAPRTLLKPRVPVINWNHPISKGLVFDEAFFEGGGVIPKDIVGKINGSFSGGGQAWGKEIFGNGMRFNNDPTSLITHLLNPSQKGLTQVSFNFLLYRASGGGIGYGMVFRNEGSGGAKFLVNNDNGDGGLGLAFQAKFSTTSGFWTVPYPTNNIWNMYTITYDGSSTSNNPIIYKNGVSIAVSTNTAPVGTLVTVNTDTNMYSGGDPTNVAGWDGRIGNLRMWNRILSLQEAKQLYQNPWQIYKQPGLI